MAKHNIGTHRYGQLFEKYLAKGKTTAQAHKIASSPLMKKPDKVDKPSVGDKVILGILRATKRKKKSKRPLVSKRSKDISSKLRNAGIDQATIDRMRGKKKSK